MKELTQTSVSQFTTLQVGGIAERACLPESENELVDLLDSLNKKNEHWSLIGGGSNLLVSSENIPGTVICTTTLNWIKILGPDLIEAGSGVRLPRLSAYASKLNLSGMEFMEGIPGTVGGAIVMNAGAHGSSTNQIITSVNILNLKKNKIETLLPKDIKFGYRISSINPKEQIVLSAKFKLVPDSETAIRTKMRENNLARRTSQPIKEPSAGCTFSNPIELNKSAGKILDELGAKNWSIGSAIVSSLHANFILNKGSATSNEVCDLIIKLQNAAYEKHNILLKPEVKPLGVFNKSHSKIWDSVNHTEKNSFIITE